MTSTQFPRLTTSYPLSFHIVAASWPSFSCSRHLFSITSRLFLQNTRGGGTPGNRSFGISSLRTLFPAPVYNSVNAVVPRPLSIRSRLSLPTTHSPHHPLSLSLCFHHLTNPFSRNPFPFTSIQNPGGVGGSRLENVAFAERGRTELMDYTVSRPASPACLDPAFPSQ